MHESSFGRMKELVDVHLGSDTSETLRILDVGSFDVNGTYRPLFDEPHWEYVGLDVAPGPGVDVVVRRLYGWKEISSRSFDVVISGQAFEHIEFVWVPSWKSHESCVLGDSSSSSFPRPARSTAIHWIVGGSTPMGLRRLHTGRTSTSSKPGRIGTMRAGRTAISGMIRCS
jgi:hypothetical protein